jgi:hypothetical protein
VLGLPKASGVGSQVDHRSRYEAITKRNVEALRRLQALQSKSAWAKWYEPIHPRDLSAELLNAFRVEISNELGDIEVHPLEWQRRIAITMASALSSDPDDRARDATEFALYETRRSNGLMDPERRRRYHEVGPDSKLSIEEHGEIESILKAWLLDALREFSSEVGDKPNC